MAIQIKLKILKNSDKAFKTIFYANFDILSDDTLYPFGPAKSKKGRRAKMAIAAILARLCAFLVAYATAVKTPIANQLVLLGRIKNFSPVARLA